MLTEKEVTARRCAITPALHTLSGQRDKDTSGGPSRPPPAHVSRVPALPARAHEAAGLLRGQPEARPPIPSFPLSLSSETLNRRRADRPGGSPQAGEHRASSPPRRALRPQEARSLPPCGQRTGSAGLCVWQGCRGETIPRWRNGTRTCHLPLRSSGVRTLEAGTSRWPRSVPAPTAAPPRP